jgi:tRNA threonylcarbamoyladenosine biosynthesis protein TsaE
MSAAGDPEVASAPPLASLRTDSVEGTRRVARGLAALLRPGDLLVLAGDLGGGKTAFVQGLAGALGVAGRVTSPTFTLAQTYEGRLRLHHLDAYRLERPGEVVDLNLPELLDDRAGVAIEWGDRILSALPRDYLRIGFRFGGPTDPPDVRFIDVHAVGPSWRLRAPAIAAAVTSGERNN